jgi:hypothetical protein
MFPPEVPKTIVDPFLDWTTDEILAAPKDGKLICAKVNDA